MYASAVHSRDGVALAVPRSASGMRDSTTQMVKFFGRRLPCLCW